jgi:hypothetical protein
MRTVILHRTTRADAISLSPSLRVSCDRVTSLRPARSWPAIPMLFCMPFAGGSSLTYAPWSRPLAAAGIEMRALDYPGRGPRAHWAFSETVIGLVDILQSEVVSASAVDTYCLFGSSRPGIPFIRPLMQVEAISRLS